MRNKIVVTGGAGFVGSNLIDFLTKKTNFRILSIDNYSSGSKKNHIINKFLAWQRPTLPCLKTKYHRRRKA